MKYIVGNWKSNHNLQEALAFLDELKTIETTNPKQDQTEQTIICPPFPLVEPMSAYAQKINLDLKFGVQNLSSYPSGAYTGEVCVQNLEDLGVDYVILGHSERRRYLEETSAQVASKITQALIGGIKPILCLDQPYFEEQAATLDSSQFEQIIIAFEPLAAIGTGQSLEPENVAKYNEQIKAIYGSQTPILYGGSVTGDSVRNYLEIGDGVLVGGASLTAESFRKLYR